MTSKELEARLVEAMNQHPALQVQPLTTMSQTLDEPDDAGDIWLRVDSSVQLNDEKYAKRLVVSSTNSLEVIDHAINNHLRAWLEFFRQHNEGS